MRVVIAPDGAGGTAIRPRYSASAPTIAQESSATLTHALPERAEKRCCASHRNILAPATQPPMPMMHERQQLEPRRAQARARSTQACSASTA